MKLNNAELVQKLGSNDEKIAEQTFKEFMRALMPKIRPAIRRIIRDRDAVNDIVQEAFCRLWFLRKILNIDNVEAYFLTVAKNLAKKQYERLRIEATANFEYYLDRGESEGMIVFDEHPVDSMLMFKDLVGQITPRRSQLLRGLVLKGKTREEIMREMNITVNTYKSTMRLGCQEIRDKVNQYRRKK